MKLVIVVKLWLVTAMSSLVTALSVSEIFQRPVMSRLYQSTQYTLDNVYRKTGERVNITQVAAATAGLKPSYVCSTMYLNYGDNLTSQMISDFNTLRSAVLATSPNAKFDVEVDLTPDTNDGRLPFPNATALVSYMEYLDDELKLDAWWFDNWAVAQKMNPSWVTAAVEYAQSHNQTVGGNIYSNIIPPSSDAVAFVDFPSNSSFGFGINTTQIDDLKTLNTSTILLGHLNCNPQKGNSTESCVYIYDWNSSERLHYFNYWDSQQSALGFTYLIPLFFPTCPGPYAYDPLSDYLGSAEPANISSISNATMYDYIQAVVLGNATNSAASSTSSTVSSSVSASTSASSTSHSTSSLAQPSTQIPSISSLTIVFMLYSLWCFQYRP